MKCKNLLSLYAAILFAAFLLMPPSANGQGGNTISGHVYGFQRQPIYDANVELLDDLGRLLQRTRTNSTGRYFFAGMPSGRYTVRILPYQTDYEEMELGVEIVNFTRLSGPVTNPNDNVPSVQTGFANEQLDFSLRLRRGLTGTTAAVFVQEVPAEAKKLFEKAIEDLGNKKQKEGIDGLKAAITAFPKYYYALERLGNEYIGLKYYEAAAILLKEATNINPRSYRGWYGLAYSLNSLKQSSDALDAVQKALEIFPDSAEALLLSGVLMRQNKKFADAEKNLLRAKEVTKVKMPMIHWYLGLLYEYDLKRYDDAARELKLFLKAQPESKDAENIKLKIKQLEEKAKGETQSKS
jgi:tetratricopeptide (TPR) repeat protein